MLLAWAMTALLGLAGSPAQAQPGGAAPEQGLKEIEVAANAFVRGAPVPAWADLLPLPPPAKEQPNKPVVVRLADSHLRAGPPVAYLVNRAEQVNDASALSDIGQPQLQFNPQYQRLLLHKVQVVRGAEVIDHTASAKVRFLQRESGLEQGVYSGVITAALVLNDVRVGDTLHMVYTVEGENPIFGARYLSSASWEQPHPVLLRRVTLTAPSARDIRWKWVGERIVGARHPQRDTFNEGGTAMQRWRFEQRDVSSVDFEQYLPPHIQPYRWLQFSEFTDWAEVVRWAQGLFPLDAPLTSELNTLVERLKTLPDDAQRVAQALRWTQDEIRYYSVALGESSHRPHLPAEVLARRYGDCKDKSLLLVRLLNSLGIPAVPVLVSLNTRTGPGALLPSPQAFDHAVVRARVDGRDHFIDPTRLGQQSLLERLGQGLEDALVLPVEAGTGALVAVRSAQREALFTNELTERFRVVKFGDAGVLEIEQVWNGLGAEGLRVALPRMDAEQRRKWLLGGYDRRYPGITLDGEPQFADDVAQNRIAVKARYQVPQLAREFAGDWALRFFPANFQGSFALPERVTRQFPVLIPAYPGKLVYRAEVHWPDSVSVINDPHSSKLDTPHFQLQSMRAFRGNVASTTLTLQPSVATVSAQDLPRLLEDLRKLDQQVGGVFVVAASQIKSSGFLGLGKTTLQDNMKKRLATQIERSGKAIEGGHLSGDDLAEAQCSRAEALSDLERASEGMKDAQAAVKSAPQLGRSYRCRANLHYALGDFAAAVADYGRALALDDDPFTNLYRRGQARFYDGKLEQALADFSRAAAHKKDEAERLYAQLWQAWTLLRLKQPLPPEISAQAPRLARGDWPRPALAMLAGALSPEQLVAAVQASKKGDELELTLTEAWFYIAQWHLAAGQTLAARAALDKARERGITMYIEHVAAGFELQRLGAAQ